MQAQLYKLEEDIKRRKLESSHLVAERITQFFYQFVRQD
jgi:translation initiation factor 2B subunit (eIF-2B alpha/beta/delta family)